MEKNRQSDDCGLIKFLFQGGGDEEESRNLLNGTFFRVLPLADRPQVE
jgi:hypothetical protein